MTDTNTNISLNSDNCTATDVINTMEAEAAPHMRDVLLAYDTAQSDGCDSVTQRLVNKICSYAPENGCWDADKDMEAWIKVTRQHARCARVRQHKSTLGSTFIYLVDNADAFGNLPLYEPSQELADKKIDKAKQLPGKEKPKSKKLMNAMEAVAGTKFDDIDQGARKKVRAEAFRVLNMERDAQRERADELAIQDMCNWTKLQVLHKVFYWAERGRETEVLKLALNNCTLPTYASLAYRELCTRAPVSGDLWDDIENTFDGDLILLSLSLRQLFEVVWCIGAKARNKLAHTINGNNDFVDSSLSLYISDVNVPLAQTNILMWTNTLGRTISWKELYFQLHHIGVSLLLPETYYVAVQVALNNSDCISLIAPEKFNTAVARLYTMRFHTISVQDGFAISGNSPMYNEKTLVVPDRWHVFVSIYVPSATTIGVTAITMTLLSANYNARQVPLPSDELLPVKVLVHCPGVATFPMTVVSVDEITLHVAKTFQFDTGTFRLASKAGRTLTSLSGGMPGVPLDVFVNLGLRGGMLGMTQVVPLGGEGQADSERNRGSDVNEKAKTDEKAKMDGACNELKLSDEMATMFKVLQGAVEGVHDDFIGTTNNSYANIKSSWAATQSPQTVMVNNIAGRILNSWHEGVFGTVRACTRANNFLTSKYMKCTPSIGSPKVDVTLGKAFADMDKAVQTGDLVAFSQFVRINTTLCNGNAVSEALLANVQKYKGSQVGSFSSHLTKLMLYAAQMVPLEGMESTHLGNYHLRASPQPPLPYTAAGGRWPLSLQVDAPIVARIIDLKAFEGMEAGLNVAAFPPVQWGPNTWGNTVMVIPVDYAMLNQPSALAFWTLSFMEYPFLRWEKEYTQVDDAGVIKNGDVRMYTNASNARIPGIIGRVLYVVSNMFTPQNNMYELLIGSGAGAPGTVSINSIANGLNGADADITAALVAAMTINSYSALYIAITWWYKYFGGHADAIDAIIAAADMHATLGPQAYRVGNNTVGFINEQFAGGGAPNWNIAGLTEVTNQANVDLLAASFTHPVTLSVSTILGEVSGTDTSVCFLGATDVVSSVHKVWGLWEYVTKANSMPRDITAVVTRLRFVARALATIGDLALEYVAVDAGGLFAARQLPDFTKSMARDALTDYYDIIKKGFIRRLSPHTLITWKPDNHMYLDNPFIDFVHNGFTRTVTVLRKPISERQYYLELDCNKSWSITKLNTGYSVTRFIPNATILGNQVERFTSSIDPESTDTATLRQLTSTQWVTGSTAATPRFDMRLVAMNPTGQLQTNIAYKVCYPSCALDSARILDFFDVINPAALNLFDAPFYSTVPVWNLFWNQAIWLGFDSTSPYFGRVTRMNTVDYNLKVLPDTNTYATTQLSDNTSMVSTSRRAKLGLGTRHF